jgi:methionyl-tRNA synthetase
MDETKPDQSSPSGEGAPPLPPEETPPAEPEVPEVSIDHFAQVVLKTGVIRTAAPHPDADRLVVLQVDIGEARDRQIVAGIRSSWDPEDLPGRRIIVATNLKPARLRGVESRGMLLAVKGSERVELLTVEGDVAPGTRVT